MASAKILELTEENTCKICDNALGRYTCPKCNILYCSLECYRSETHLQCSEQFYRDYVMENLPAGANTESKLKMMEVLQRMHNEELTDDEAELDSDDDPEDCLDLSERMAGINLDDTEKVWENLTDNEKKDFEAFLRSEDVTKLIKRWNPWWAYHCSNKVFDMEEFEKKKCDCPRIKENIRNFSDICHKPPSDQVQYNLINILAAYVFTQRYFNGECNDFILEAVACISKSSLNLGKNINYNNFDEAIESVEIQCSTLDWLYPDIENMKFMKEDVCAVTQGPHATEAKYYVMCSLSDMHNLFNKALKVNKDGKNGGFSKAFPESKFPESELENKASIRNSIKKIEFLLSFAKDTL